jgi:hypothetical protein
VHYCERTVAVQKFKSPGTHLVAVAAVLLTSACGTAGSSAAALPEGETDLSCGGLVYAASRLVDDGKVSDPDGAIKGNAMAAITRYGTAHAKANGLDGSDAFNVVKLQGMKMMGLGSSTAGKVSADKIIARARKCMGV